MYNLYVLARLVDNIVKSRDSQMKEISRNKGQDIVINIALIIVSIALLAIIIHLKNNDKLDEVESCNITYSDFKCINNNTLNQCSPLNSNNIIY